MISLARSLSPWFVAHLCATAATCRSSARNRPGLSSPPASRPTLCPHRRHPFRANTSGAAHYPCTAGFCSARISRHGFAFPCCSLPRRHCSTAGAALGRQSKCVGHKFLDLFLSLLHVAALLLGRISV